MSRERIAELAAAVADERRSGPGDPAILEARMRLARAYKRDLRAEDAVAELRQVVALREDALGAGHPDTLAARHELAISYHLVSSSGGDPACLADAIATMELAADGRLSALGPAHRDTLASWEFLALLYSSTGRHDDQRRNLRERIAAGWEHIVAEQERQLGHDEPGTQFSRNKLAGAYGDIGRRGDRRAILERVVESWGRLAAARSQDYGPVHPDTVYARERHADSYSYVGRRDDEVALTEQIAADHERLLGPDDPRTLRALTRLAITYAGRPGALDHPVAISLGERIINDAYHALGPDDQDVRTLCALLILAYMQTGRNDQAFALRARFPMPRDKE
jgi:hypothetical protein